MRASWLFALIALDGVVPLVPGEAALLSQAPAAMAAGWPVVVGLAVLAGSAALLGDLVTYSLGRRVGTSRFAWQRRPLVARMLDRAGAALDRRGTALIMSARFLPGWRVAISFTAGATRVSWPRFLAASALGSTAWAAYMLAIGTTVAAVTGGGTILVSAVSLATIAAVGLAVRWRRRRPPRVRGRLTGRGRVSQSSRELPRPLSVPPMESSSPSP